MQSLKESLLENGDAEAVQEPHVNHPGKASVAARDAPRGVPSAPRELRRAMFGHAALCAIGSLALWLPVTTGSLPWIVPTAFMLFFIGTLAVHYVLVHTDGSRSKHAMLHVFLFLLWSLTFCLLWVDAPSSDGGVVWFLIPTLFAAVPLANHLIAVFAPPESAGLHKHFALFSLASLAMLATVPLASIVWLGIVFWAAVVAGHAWLTMG